MNITEKTETNILKLEPKWFIAQCIDRTCALGTAPDGRTFPRMLAYQIELKYGHKKYLKPIVQSDTTKNCFLKDNVFYLVTKEKHYLKPTYETLTVALQELREIILENSIENLALPKLGCGVDGLNYIKVKEIILEIFKDLEINILLMS